MRFFTFIVIFLLYFLPAYSQIVSLNPQNGGADDQVTLTFDASQGNSELLGAAKVYVHLGVITDSPTGTAWKHVIGNWGKDDGIGTMTRVPGNSDKWQITFSPSIRQYFKVDENDNIFRLACVFRNADGSKKGTIQPGSYSWGSVAANFDIFINLRNDQFILINQPVGHEGYYDPGQQVSIQASSSSLATEMKVWIDEGQGYVERHKANNVSKIDYSYVPIKSGEIGIKVTAIVNGEAVETEKTYDIVIKNPTTIAALPEGAKQGVNYFENDPTKVVLVLLAPEKSFVYAVGDFSDWKIKAENQMKRSPDGAYWWIELTGLQSDQDYVYQYWIDGQLKIADPYTRQVADPYNDQYITPSVFPNLPDYRRGDFGIAAVFRTGQKPYNWAISEQNWKKPDVNHLVIYELHIRDFLASHSYSDLIDTIGYLKRLGINAIELMPVNEFEGNDSWGYNPSFFFATDKYYGTADMLKKFIETAHQNGIAVIMDIVLNHAFGQCPMVQMYFDGGKPAKNNPWFNREYVGQYQWGYDFNHESKFTQDFVDDVNRYWIEEFHFDGFRFDFTKGFTNYAPGGNIDGFDQSRINILKRMADKIWEFDDDAYVILEHWGTAAEENRLAGYGMKMWRNKSYDFVPSAIGNTNGTFSNHDAITHVSFYDSHDERRIAEHCLTEGKSSGTYNIRDTIIMLERIKMAAAFTYLQPGPKMIWQFDELGYDVHIDFNGRTGKKPLPWGKTSLKYYEDPLRQNVYKTYQGLLQLRNEIGPQNLSNARKNHQPTGVTRRLVFDADDTDLVVIGNISLQQQTINPEFTQTGWWYDYFTGDSIYVATTTADIPLKIGEWHVYTSTKLSSGVPGAVAVYDNPVTVEPFPFHGSDKITITFDANKAFPGDTEGLKDATKVYMHAGVILSDATHSKLTNVKGTFQDDGIGQMTALGNNLWKITLVPDQYFEIPPGKSIHQIGMWFRNEDNTKVGYGFRNRVIFVDVLSDEPILSVDPPSFNADTEITITFNARQGNRELIGTDKVYMHAGVVLRSTTNPKGTDWSKVVGTWGADDGQGLMTKVAGKPDLWQIKLNPSTYFGLSGNEFPYWIGAVFRNASGNIKGTTDPGNYDFGIVEATSLDFFIKNQQNVKTEDTSSAHVILYPNPASDQFIMEGILGEYELTFYTLQGKIIHEGSYIHGQFISCNTWPKGIYLYTIKQKGKLIQNGKLVIQ